VSSSSSSADSALAKFFRFVIAKRWIVIALYALLLPPSAWFAMKVTQDNDIQRVIVPNDPDFLNMKAFQQVFGAGEYAVLLAECEDCFAPDVLARVDKIEQSIGAIDRVSVNSALSIYRRAKAGFSGTPAEAAGFKKFVNGTALLKKQGMFGDHFIAISVVLDVKSNADRSELLAKVDKAIDDAGGGSPPLTKLRKVGQPYVNAHLDEATRQGGKYFGLFGAFAIVLIVALYRSARTLAAFLITLGVCMAMSVGYIGLTGGTFTIVSPMVPMTILVTATATLVYMHSRFVDRPAEVPVDDHQVFALENKFVACTASIFATLVGFAALVVSTIRPIREMGIWVAVGLFMTWIIVFTLFPALQKVLKTPTSHEQQAAGAWFIAFTEWLPRASYRWRWPLVLGALAMMTAGSVALFGLRPAGITPMQLLIDPVEYVSHDSDLYRDTKYVQHVLPGLSITEIWLKGTKNDCISEPKALAGLARFHQALEKDPDVGAVVSPISLLQMVRYLGGQGDTFPTDPDGLEQVASDLEATAPREPTLGRFVQANGMSQAHFAVITRVTEHDAFRALAQRVHALWDAEVARTPELAGITLETVGLGPLQAKMSQNLVPTLVESFLLTAAIIFLTFIAVFRSGPARIMTMIPSLFAILVMFGVMRLTGMKLNVATILIASTVLGTSENDQIHFFYHFLEKRKEGSVEQALRHTLLVSGKAIFFATLINAGGFVAFALSPLPPVFQFGELTAIALAMSMLADFTALPAALWIIFRQKPDATSADAADAKPDTRP
jgi:predicted RND superfamily exporter protein